MGHTSFGYRIESGKAVIDEKEAEQIRQVYHFYLAGYGLMTAAGKAGITSFHGGVSRMLRNKHYLGDEYYPAIIDQRTFDRAEAERQRRAEFLGRIRSPQEQEEIIIPNTFHMRSIEQKFDDPFRQAEYAYGQIESEGLDDAGK